MNNLSKLKFGKGEILNLTDIVLPAIRGGFIGLFLGVLSKGSIYKLSHLLTSPILSNIIYYITELLHFLGP